MRRSPLAQRAAVVAVLPEVTHAEMALPQGDLHIRAKVGALTALRGYFARQKRRIYLVSELPIYHRVSRGSRRT